MLCHTVHPEYPWDRVVRHKMTSAGWVCNIRVALPQAKRTASSSPVTITSDCRNVSCFLARKSSNSSNDQKRKHSFLDRVCITCCMWAASNWGNVRFSVLFFSCDFNCNKRHFEWYLTEPEWLSYGDHNGPAPAVAEHQEKMQDNDSICSFPQGYLNGLNYYHDLTPAVN